MQTVCRAERKYFNSKKVNLNRYKGRKRMN